MEILTESFTYILYTIFGLGILAILFRIIFTFFK